MRVDGQDFRTLRPAPDATFVEVIDQRRLPHEFVLLTVRDLPGAAEAIRDMAVRGAPLIGVTAAYGLALALRADSSDDGLDAAHATLAATRPTAVNLRWALDRVRNAVRPHPPAGRAAAAWALAGRMAEEDVAVNAAIGRHGLGLLRGLWQDRQRQGARRLNLLTHCNAGWLACIDWGTATAPIYLAHRAGIPVHVWVDETRPRSQGAALTAWELGAEGVPHTLVADNAGGHLMQHGEVDACVVGTDRVTTRGDVANKIGTYLKALAAAAAGLPFYVALPSSTIDWTVRDGVAEIPIEERSAREVTHVRGRRDDGTLAEVRICPEATPAANPAFDVTPARLVTALITERGVVPASANGLYRMFPERQGWA